MADLQRLITPPPGAYCCHYGCNSTVFWCLVWEWGNARRLTRYWCALHLPKKFWKEEQHE